jgi:hypothetical protein
MLRPTSLGIISDKVADSRPSNTIISEWGKMSKTKVKKHATQIKAIEKHEGLRGGYHHDKEKQPAPPKPSAKGKEKELAISATTALTTQTQSKPPELVAEPVMTAFTTPRSIEMHVG